ncbi:MAG: patatin-like phospholipase family protein, partial [Treponema sp.]|nr:patatin-like phospholipase family protein [Treponema sp.]
VANWIPKLDNYEFNYYAGTSVGSILAACYAIGMKPEEVQKMFNSEIPKRIFSKPKNILQRASFFRKATYGNEGAKKVFKEVFGDRTIKDTKYPLSIVAWNYEKRKEKVFTHRFNSDYLLRDAVLASVSAPTFFPVAEIGKEKLGDGGVCGNDPSLAGIAAIRDDGFRIKDIKCLSIGTTGKPKEKTLKVYTKLGWLPVLIDIITTGNVSYTSYGVSHLLSDKEKPERYLRITPSNLPSGSMDNFKLVPKIKEVWEQYPHREAYKFLYGREV